MAGDSRRIPSTHTPPRPGHTSSGPGWPVVLGVCVALVIWCMVDVRRRARSGPDASHRTDFTVYTEAGEAFFDGRDPYAVTNPRGWHYLYPPLFAILVSPLEALDSQWQAVVWFFISAAMAFGCYCEGRRIVRALAGSPGESQGTRVQGSGFRVPGEGTGSSRACLNAEPRTLNPERRRLPPWLGVLAAAAVALPVLNCMQRGQVGVAVIYLLMLGFRLVFLGRSWSSWMLGGIVLALPVTIKLTPALPVAVLVGQLGWEWLRRVRGGRQPSAVGRQRQALPAEPGLHPRRLVPAGLGVAAGGLLFVLLIPAALVGWSDNIGALETWVARVVANEEVGEDNDFHVRSLRNQSLANGVYRLGNWLAYAFADGPDDLLIDERITRDTPMPMDDPWFGRLLLAARLGLLGLLLAVALRLARTGPAGQAAVFGLACAATLLVSPLSWGHHYTIFLPAALFVPFWLWQSRGERTARLMAAAPVVLSLLHYCLLDYAGRAGILGIGTTLWFLAACAFALRARRPGRPSTGDRPEHASQGTGSPGHHWNLGVRSQQSGVRNQRIADA